MLPSVQKINTYVSIGHIAAICNHYKTFESKVQERKEEVGGKSRVTDILRKRYPEDGSNIRALDFVNRFAIKEDAGLLSSGKWISGI